MACIANPALDSFSRRTLRASRKVRLAKRSREIRRGGLTETFEAELVSDLEAGIKSIKELIADANSGRWDSADDEQIKSLIQMIQGSTPKIHEILEGAKTLGLRHSKGLRAIFDELEHSRDRLESTVEGLSLGVDTNFTETLELAEKTISNRSLTGAARG
jgi:hypothetical protein